MSEPETPEQKTKFDLDEIDSILESEDPEFLKSLDELKKDGLGAGAEIQSLDLDDNVIGQASETSDEEKSSADSKKGGIRNWTALLFARTKALPSHFLASLPFIIDAVKSVLRRAFKKVIVLTVWFQDLNRSDKLRLLGIAGLFVLSYFVARYLITSRGLLGELTQVEITSLAPYADQTIDYNNFNEWSSYGRSLKRPQYLFLFKKMVVRLQTQGFKEASGFFEVYVDPSTQRASVEIQRNESELRDLLSRAIEGFTPAQLRSSTGKEKLKLALKSRLNTRLESGYVRDVYFKSLIIKE